jgi:hypothetical protein
VEFEGVGRRELAVGVGKKWGNKKENKKSLIHPVFLLTKAEIPYLIL